MIEIRYLKSSDKQFWYSLDKHLPEAEFVNKVHSKRGYVILINDKPYNLFWDNTPFCTMLMIDEIHRGKGYGKQLIEYWEYDMKVKGYGMLLISTQVNEIPQNFYRKLGYKDCGCLVIDVSAYVQPMEMFFIKAI